mmetsp:Transcript_15917/g.31981  ORF Transcript_15917/g.31981 Transcript_15917/m.31981 type:complete len:302 (-) Transcript_15917:1305-2210(-)
MGGRSGKNAGTESVATSRTATKSGITSGSEWTTCVTASAAATTETAENLSARPIVERDAGVGDDELRFLASDAALTLSSAQRQGAELWLFRIPPNLGFELLDGAILDDESGSIEKDGSQIGRLVMCEDTEVLRELTRSTVAMLPEEQLHGEYGRDESDPLCRYAPSTTPISRLVHVDISEGLPQLSPEVPDRCYPTPPTIAHQTLTMAGADCATPRLVTPLYRSTCIARDEGMDRKPVKERASRRSHARHSMGVSEEAERNRMQRSKSRRSSGSVQPDPKKRRRSTPVSPVTHGGTMRKLE